MKIHNVSVDMYKSIVYEFRDVPIEEVPYWCLYAMRRPQIFDRKTHKTTYGKSLSVVHKYPTMTLEELHEFFKAMKKEYYDAFLKSGGRFVAYPRKSRKSRNVRPRRSTTNCQE